MALLDPFSKFSDLPASFFSPHTVLFFFFFGGGWKCFFFFRRFGLEYDSMRFFEGLQRKRVLRHIPRSSYSRPFYLKKERKTKRRCSANLRWSCMILRYPNPCVVYDSPSGVRWLCGTRSVLHTLVPILYECLMVYDSTPGVRSQHWMRTPMMRVFWGSYTKFPKTCTSTFSWDRYYLFFSTQVSNKSICIMVVSLKLRFRSLFCFLPLHVFSE